TVRVGDSWMVRIDRETLAHEFLNRAGPLLRAIAILAATRITPSEAAGLLAAYDRFADAAGAAPASSRADAYALYMRRLASASGSSFHVLAVDLMLLETSAVLIAFFETRARDAGAPGPEAELAWLARALMGGDGSAALESVDKHLHQIGLHLSAAPAA
ncbi:MAG: hypothetical protein ACRC1J_01020, partial [Sandaracinobacteroides sp.]